MIELRKWNYETKVYDKVEYEDEDLVFVLFTRNMDLVVNCPHCLKKMKYGSSFTSLEFHNAYGLGYPVCAKCYYEEWDRRRKYREDL